MSGSSYRCRANGVRYGPIGRTVSCPVFSSDGVETNTSDRLSRWVLGLEVLVGEQGVLFDQFFEDVVAHTALALGWTNTRFVERLGHSSRHADVEVWAARRFITKVIALEQDWNNPWSLVARLSLADPHALGFLEPNADARRG
jgi:hypothetical protein